MINYDVKPDGGDSYKLTATTRDILAWEKRTGKSWSLIRDGLPMQDLYNIAHAAALRQGMFSGNLEEFEKSVDIDPAPVDDKPDPTQ